MSSGLIPRKAALRPTTRRKMFGRAATNYNVNVPTPKGWAPRKAPPTPVTNQRAVRTKLGWWSPSPPRRVRGTAAPQHRITRLREPRRLEGGRDGGGRGVRVHVGGGWGGGAGRTVWFFSIVFSFCQITLRRCAHVPRKPCKQEFGSRIRLSCLHPLQYGSGSAVPD